jgi:hypothetical protein
MWKVLIFFLYIAHNTMQRVCKKTWKVDMDDENPLQTILIDQILKTIIYSYPGTSRMLSERSVLVSFFKSYGYGNSV